MIKFASLTILLFICFDLQAQNESYYPESSDSTNYLIEIHGGGHFGSNAINYSIVKGFLYKIALQPSYIGETLQHTGVQNRAGGDFNFGLSFEINRFKKFPQWGFITRTGHQATFSTSFPKDAIVLLLRGNAPFEEKTADFSDTHFTIWNYQFLKAGLTYSLNKKNTMKAGILLGFYKGQDFADIVVNKGSLYTALFGEYVNATVDYEAAFSDTAHKGFSAINGIGMGADIIFEYKTPPLKIRFDALDIGIMQWNKHSLFSKYDTTIRFDGIEIENILKIDSTAFDGISNDTLLDRLMSKKTQNIYNSWLPSIFKIHAEYQYLKYIGIAGVQYRLLSNYLPFVYIGAGYQIGTSSIRMLTSWGGWTSWNVGLEFLFRTQNLKHSLTFRTFALPGWLASEKSLTMDIAVKYQFHF